MSENMHAYKKMKRGGQEHETVCMGGGKRDGLLVDL